MLLAQPGPESFAGCGVQLQAQFHIISCINTVRAASMAANRTGTHLRMLLPRPTRGPRPLRCCHHCSWQTTGLWDWQTQHGRAAQHTAQHATHGTARHVRQDRIHVLSNAPKGSEVLSLNFEQQLSALSADLHALGHDTRAH